MGELTHPCSLQPKTQLSSLCLVLWFPETNHMLSAEWWRRGTRLSPTLSTRGEMSRPAASKTKYLVWACPVSNLNCSVLYLASTQWPTFKPTPRAADPIEDGSLQSTDETTKCDWFEMFWLLWFTQSMKTSGYGWNGSFLHCYWEQVSMFQCFINYVNTHIYNGLESAGIHEWLPKVNLITDKLNKLRNCSYWIFFWGGCIPRCVQVLSLVVHGEPYLMLGI